MAFPKCALLLTLLQIGVAKADPGPLAPPNSDYRWANAAAVEKWHDLKFGLRIHWGLYGAQGVGPESWPLNENAKNASFLKNYWESAKTFNPKKYDPDAWIALMKRAGLKYFDFTTKHHEGFSMFDTKTKVHDCWDFETSGSSTQFAGIKACGDAASGDGIAFSSTEAFGRDITGELIAAARKGGIEPGLYFSHIDWFDADMRIDQWNPLGTGLCKGQACDPAKYSKTANSTEWARFVLRHRAQMMEVLTKYGEVLEMSFDMNFPAEFDADMYDTMQLARSLAPNTLFRGRGMGGYKGTCNERTTACGMGDYETPEETFPDSPIPGNWQVIYHGSHFMSFDPNPANYVNGSFIVWHLADIVSKGGLMEIGYGPDANGEFHPKAVEALEYAGQWLSTNGEAIYATQPMPQHWNDTASSMVRYTRSKNSSTIYAIALSGFGSAPLPVDGKLQLACVKPAPGGAMHLLGYETETTREPLPVQWVQQGDMAIVTIPSDLAEHPAVMAPGLVLKFQGVPQSCAHADSDSSAVMI